MTQLRLPWLLLLLCVMAACGRADPRLEGEVVRTEPWSAEVVERMASVMVQDNGRGKPLSVLAAFRVIFDGVSAGASFSSSSFSPIEPGGGGAFRIDDIRSCMSIGTTLWASSSSLLAER